MRVSGVGKTGILRGQRSVVAAECEAPDGSFWFYRKSVLTIKNALVLEDT